MEHYEFSKELPSARKHIRDADFGVNNNTTLQSKIIAEGEGAVKSYLEDAKSIEKHVKSLVHRLERLVEKAHEAAKSEDK